jgi:hypothetical protein
MCPHFIRPAKATSSEGGMDFLSTHAKLGLIGYHLQMLNRNSDHLDKGC